MESVVHAKAGMQSASSHPAIRSEETAETVVTTDQHIVPPAALYETHKHPKPRQVAWIVSRAVAGDALRDQRVPDPRSPDPPAKPPNPQIASPLSSVSSISSPPLLKLSPRPKPLRNRHHQQQQERQPQDDPAGNRPSTRGACCAVRHLPTQTGSPRFPFPTIICSHALPGVYRLSSCHHPRIR